MCNSNKIGSIFQKLALNRAAGKNGIFAEHICMLTQARVITLVA